MPGQQKNNIRHGEALEFLTPGRIQVIEANKEKLRPGILAVVQMGKVQEGDIVNGNGRFYPWSELQREGLRIQADIAARKSIMAFSHPSWSAEEFDRDAAVLTKLVVDNENRILGPAEAEVMDSHYGRELMARLHAEAYVGISSRAYGDLIYKDVQLKDGTVVQADVMTNLELIAFDFVRRQSVPGASVTGFRECQEGERRNKGDKNMTLEELRAKYPDLVKALLDEAKVGDQKAQDEAVAKAIEAKLPEAVTAALAKKLEAGEYVPASAVEELVKVLEGLGYTKNGEPLQGKPTEGAKKDTTASFSSATPDASALEAALEAERKARKALEDRIASLEKSNVEAVAAQKLAEAEAYLAKVLPELPKVIEAWIREDGFATQEDVEALVKKHTARAKDLMGQQGHEAQGKVVLDPKRGDEGLDGKAGDAAQNAVDTVDPLLRMAAGKYATTVTKK